LTHVRRLIAPGGKLIVLEGTRPVRWLDLTFGLTSGWWRFRDSLLRADYPLLSIGAWRRLLDELGWDAIRIIPPFPMSGQDREPESAVILSQVDEQLPSDNTLAPAGASSRWMVFADDQGYGAALAAHLQDTLRQPCLSTHITDHLAISDTPPADHSAVGHVNSDSLARLCASASRPTDVVFLWSLADIRHAHTPAEHAQQLSELLLLVIQSMAAGLGNDPHTGSPGIERLRWWIVTRGAQLSNGTEDGLAQAALWGLARTLALEYPHWDCRLIDLDPDADPHAAIRTLIDEVSGSTIDADSEIMFRDGLRRVRRLVNDSPPGDARDMTTVLRVASRGTLAGLALVPQPRRAPGSDEVEIEVHASGLNFRDVLSLLGQYPGEPPLGAECAGKVLRVGTGVREFEVGDAVVAIAPNSFCDYLSVGADAVVKVPSCLSLRDAATIPVAFLTASVALEEMACIRRGNRVLIHSATGGVGLAAIQLARDAGAEIFATASEGKQETLRELGIEHVYDSRRPGFTDGILEATAGAGVDVVLNTLGPEFLPENLRALAAGGRYVDITKTDHATVRQALGARPDVVFHTLDLAALLQARRDHIQADLGPLLNRFAAGQLHPLPSRCFSLADAQNAFRFMRSARHIGKIVIQPERSSRDMETAGDLAHATRACRAGAPIRDDACYLITGGLGGLGLEVARWLAQRGARHIGLLARRPPTAAEQPCIAQMMEHGATVEVLRGDVSRAADVHAALEVLRRGGRPLAGVFQLAGVLDDALIVRQSPEKFARVFAPKVAGTWNLHCATLDQSLDYFVLFSSAAAAFGSAGQANHAAANAFLDALAGHRRSRGLPGQAINWGPWSSIGAAASRDVAHRGDFAGIGMLTPAEGISILENTLVANHVQVVAVRLDWEQLPARWKERPLFEKLIASSAITGLAHQHASEFLATYRTTPESQQRNCLLAHLRSLVGRTLGISDPATIPSDQALSDLGLDSLASLELSHCIEESLETTVSSTLVYDFPTLNDMVAHFAPILPIDNAKSSAPSAQIFPDGTVTSLDSAEQSNQNGAVSNDERLLLDDASRGSANAAEVLQGIHELRQELDRWDEV
jgi:NADPH:quinone reductase-like Zn-dependent oxidoreductase/NADP-dependent 3-hydroxy acid dehydrogenase YdfG/acyl carrier protein